MKVHLNRVRLNKGGYDDKGQYWGVSDISLYCYEYESEGNIITDHLRASNRDIAKHKISEFIRVIFKSVAKFYR